MATVLPHSEAAQGLEERKKTHMRQRVVLERRPDHVRRIVSGWSRLGIVKAGRGRITIRDPQRLAELAAQSRKFVS